MYTFSWCIYTYKYRMRYVNTYYCIYHKSYMYTIYDCVLFINASWRALRICWEFSNGSCRVYHTIDLWRQGCCCGNTIHHSPFFFESIAAWLWNYLQQGGSLIDYQRDRLIKNRKWQKQQDIFVKWFGACIVKVISVHLQRLVIFL